jgi:xanthine dehydrogenase YagR molybdenum-binding subunit
MAAIALKRSVRVTLTRQQMILGFGQRPQTIQTISLGADESGHLTAVKHDAVANTSRFEDYQENVVNWAGALYRCDNSEFSHRLVQLDLATPMDMRAPGAAAGVYALECAMDELSYAVGIDPLELRLKNYSELEQNANKPFSSKALKDCYYRGAEKFGWSKRNPEPRSMRDGRELIGYGMASGIWEALRVPTSADVELTPEGRLVVSTAAADIGTRHLYNPDADRCRDARPGARQGRDQDRRFRSAGLPRRRRVLDGGLGGFRRYAGLRQHPPTAAQACAKAQGLAAEGRRTRRSCLRRR